MALATISIDLVAQLAKFEGDMRRAAGVVEQAAQRMDRAFGGIGSVFAGSLLANAATEAVRQLATLVPELVNSVARFQDLEEKTGASAEALAGFQTAADVSGTSVDALAGFMVKLTGTLSKTNDETKGAGGALKALGLDLQAFRNLKPEEQFTTLAQRLGEFKDGAGKTAIAIALLGKSGADALPFFKELAQSGLAQNRLTAEQIKLADDLADRQAKLRSELRQAAQVVALQALPAFNALVEEFGKVIRATAGLDDAASGLGDNSGVREFAEGAAISLATVGEAVVGLVRLIRSIGGSFESVFADVEFAGTLAAKLQVLNKGGLFNEDNRNELRAALDKRNKIAEEANERYVRLFTESGTKVSDALRNQFGAQALGRQAGLDDIEKLFPAKDKPSLRFVAPDSESGANKAARDAEQARQARLQQALKATEAIFANERDAIQFQQQFLEAEYRSGLVSIDAYYTERAALGERALKVELDSYAERADLVRADAQRYKEGTDERIKLETQLADIEAKAAAARRESSQKTQLDALDQVRAYKQLTDQVRDFQAELLELQGDAAGAARLRADDAINKARSFARTTNGRLSEEDLRNYERAIRANTELAEVQRRVERSGEAARIAEERFLIAAEAGAASRAEVEQGVTAIRREQLDQLRQLLAATEALAQGQGADSPAVQAAARLRLEYERAAAQVDLLKLRLQDFADTTAGQIAGSITDAVIDGNWKEAGRRIGQDLVRGILEEEFTRPLQDELKKLLRGGIDGADGPLSVLGNAVSKLFSGGASSAASGIGGALTADAALLGLSTSAIGAEASVLIFGESLLALGLETDIAFSGLSAAAELAAEALLGVAASGRGGGGAGLFDLGSIFSAEGAGAEGLELFATEAAAATTATAGLTEAGLAAAGALTGMGPIVAGIGALLSATGGQVAGALGLLQATGGQVGGLVGLLQSGIVDRPGGFLGLLGSFFDEGGYTGNAPTGAPAGVVHGKEYVFSAPAVARLGVPALDQMHRQARAGAMLTGLPGYADGGFVAPRVVRGPSQAPAPAARSGGMRPIVVNSTVNFNGDSVPDRRTRQQVAAEWAQDVQEAMARGTAGAY